MPINNRDVGNTIDEAARILASPLPRRQALRALGNILIGSLLAALGVKQANAGCIPGCASGQTCCPGLFGNVVKPFCIAAGRICCGSTSCASGQTCCTDEGQYFCVAGGRTCCGLSSCASNQSCCSEVCCSNNQACKFGRCQASQS